MDDTFKLLAKHYGIPLPDDDAAPAPGPGKRGRVPSSSWRGKRSLSQDELEDVLREAGWAEKHIPRMSAIGMAESALDQQGKAKVNSYNPGVGPGGRPTVEQSIGNWQINMHPSLGRRYDRQKLASDPLYNAKAALDIFNQQGFKAWGAYTDGRFKKFLRKKPSPIRRTATEPLIEKEDNLPNADFVDNNYTRAPTMAPNGDIPAPPNFPTPVLNAVKGKVREILSISEDGVPAPPPMPTDWFVRNIRNERNERRMPAIPDRRTEPTFPTEAAPNAAPIANRAITPDNELTSRIDTLGGVVPQNVDPDVWIAYQQFRNDNRLPEGPESIQAFIKASSDRSQQQQNYQEYLAAGGLSDTKKNRATYQRLIKGAEDAARTQNAIDARQLSRQRSPQAPRLPSREAQPSREAAPTASDRWTAGGEKNLTFTPTRLGTRDQIIDDVAAQVSSAIRADFKVVRDVLSQYALGDTTNRPLTRDEADRMTKSRRAVPWVITPRAIQQIKLQSEQKRSLESAFDRQSEKYMAEGMQPSEAMLRAGKDIGQTTWRGMPIDEAIATERDATRRILKAAAKIPAEPLDLRGIDRARFGLPGASLSTARSFTPEEIESFRQAQYAEISKNIRAASPDGTFLGYEKEQQRLAEKYGYNARPLARGLEFAKSLGAAVPKAVASLLKTADLMTNFNPMATGYEALSGKGFTMDEGVLSDIGNAINGYIESKQHEYFKNDFLLNVLPDTIGQLGVQIAAGVLTGGAALPTVIGAAMGGASQFDEAKKFENATEEQKGLAFIVGGAAAVPDAIIFNKWFKGATAAEKDSFLQNITRSLLARFGVRYGDKAAEDLTRSFLAGWAKNAPKDGLFEGSQEVLENKINDLVAYLSYDPSAERSRRVKSVTDEDVVSFVAGLIGGAGGAAVQTKLSGMAVKDRPTILSKILSEIERQATNPEQAAALSSEVFAQAKRFNITLKPLVVAEQKQQAREVDEQQQQQPEKAQISKPAPPVEPEALAADKMAQGKEPEIPDEVKEEDQTKQRAAAKTEPAQQPETEPARTIGKVKPFYKEDVSTARMEPKAPAQNAEKVEKAKTTIAEAEKKGVSLPSEALPTFETAKQGDIYRLSNGRVAIRGTHERGAGERIFNTVAEAKAFQEDRARRQAENDRFLAEQERKRQEQAKQIAEYKRGLEGFTANMTPMQKGRIEKTLAKRWTHEGKVQTTKQIIDGLAAKGELELRTEEVNKIADMTRRQRFRSTGQQQEEHDRRQKEAGTKTVYYINDLELGKIAYDYAQSLSTARTEPKTEATDVVEKTPTVSNKYSAPKPDISQAITIPAQNAEKVEKAKTTIAEKKQQAAEKKAGKPEKPRYNQEMTERFLESVPEQIKELRKQVSQYDPLSPAGRSRIRALEKEIKTLERDLKGYEKDLVFHKSTKTDAEGKKPAEQDTPTQGDTLKSRAAAPFTMDGITIEFLDDTDTTNNASGESSASAEAMSRSREENRRGEYRVAVDTHSGRETPIIGTDGVDAYIMSKGFPDSSLSIEWRGGKRDGEIIAKGNKAVPYRRREGQSLKMVARASQATDPFTESATLFHKDTPESRSYVQSLRKARFADLAQNAEANFKGENLEVNEEGGEIIRRVLIEDNITTDKNSFYGLTQSQGDTQRVAKGLDGRIKESRDLGYTDEEMQGLIALRDRFDDLAKQKYGITYLYDEALPHESHHKLVLEALDGQSYPKTAIDKLKASKVWTEAKVRDADFDTLYPDISDEHKAFEIAAGLETGDIKHQDRIQFLRDFADGIIEVTTNEELNDQERYTRIFQYASNKANNQRGSDRAGVSETKEQSDSEPGDAKDKGTRDKDQTAAFTPGGKEKLSQTPFTLRDKGQIPVKNRIYTATTNSERIEFANRQMDKGLDEAIEWVNRQANDNNLNSGATAVVGINTMARLGAEGRIDELNKMADTVLQMVTESAQTVQAISIVSMFSPEYAGVYATGVAKQNGVDITPEQEREAVRIAREMSDVVQAEAIIDAALAEAERIAQERLERINEIEELLGIANSKAKQYKGEVSGLKREIKSLRRKTEGEKEAKTQLKKDVKERLAQIRSRRDEINAKLDEIYGGQTFKMAAPPDAVNDTEINPDLADWALDLLADEIGTMTPEQFIDAVRVRTNGQISEGALNRLHAETVTALKGDSSSTLTDGRRAKMKIRQSHYRRAQKYYKDLKKGDEWTKTVTEIGVDAGFSDEAIWTAIARKKYADVNDLIQALIKEFPSLKKDTNTRHQVLSDSERLLTAIKAKLLADRLAEKEGVKLNESDIERIKEEKEFNRQAKARVTRTANRFYGSMVKTKFEVAVETLVNYRRANLLTAIKTQLVNLGGNAGHAIGEEIATYPAVAIDMLASVFTNERTITPSPEGILKGLKAIIAQDETLKNATWESKEGRERGVTAAKHILMYGGSIEDMERLQHTESILSTKFEGRTPEWTDTYINGVFRSLGAGDALFKVYAFRRHLESQARAIALTEKRQNASVNVKERTAELVKQPTAVMQELANQFAHELTFQNNNWLSTAIMRAKRDRLWVKAPVEIVMPYDRTPTNIVFRTLEHTPAGFIMAVAKLVSTKGGTRRFRNQFRAAIIEDLSKEVKDWNSIPATKRREMIDKGLAKLQGRVKQEAFARVFGRATAGSTAQFGLGFLLAAMGYMTGAMSPEADDRKETDEFYKRKRIGIENGSILLKGYGRIVLPKSPATAALVAGATFYEQMKMSKKDPFLAAMGATSETLTDIAAEQPLFSSTYNLYRNLIDRGAFGSFTGNILSGFVPASGMMRSMAEVADPKARTTSGSKTWDERDTWRGERDFQLRGLKNSALYGIPFIRNYVVDESQTAVSDEERGGPIRRFIRILDFLNTRSPIPYESPGPPKGKGTGPADEEKEKRRKAYEERKKTRNIKE